MSFQISAPSKKASARWENTFGLWLHSSVSWSISLSVHQPKEEMVFSGKYKTGEQILRLANERFAVPEMLFHPSDIGIQEMGIPEAIVDSIQSLPEGLTFFPTSPLCCRIAYALVFNSYKYRDFDSRTQKRAETLCFSIRKSVFKWIPGLLSDLLFLSSEMQPHFYQNIVLTGGNTLFPGFRERLEAELRSLVPAHLPVSVLLPQK